LAACVQGGFAGGEGEAVILGVTLVEDGKDAVVLGLVNVACDKLAEADAVAEQVHAVADGDFKQGKVALAGEVDFAELDDGFGARGVCRDWLRRGEDFRSGEGFAEGVEPACAVVGLSETGLEFGGGHGRESLNCSNRCCQLFMRGRQSRLSPA
jgi:hypothetical protein